MGGYSSQYDTGHPMHCSPVVGYGGTLGSCPLLDSSSGCSLLSGEGAITAVSLLFFGHHIETVAHESKRFGLGPTTVQRKGET